MGGEAKKIVLAGNVILDVVKRVDAWPEQGRLVSILDESRSCGGAVCNSGVTLKTMDPSVSVSAYGLVGDDEYGRWLCSFLSDRGLDVSRLRRTASASTSYTDVVTVASTGARTFFHARGANSLFSASDVDAGSLDCDIFHLGYLLLLDSLDAADGEYGTAAARLLHDVQERGVATSIDLVSEQSGRFADVVRPALKYCDYLVVNEIEGAQATGLPCRDESGRVTAGRLAKIAEALMGMGVRRSVTLHCPEMGVTLCADGSFSAVGSLVLPSGWIRGAVGAGDAFCAGMLHSFLTGAPADLALRLASAAAAANLAVGDSVSGALSLEATLDLDRRFERRKTQC